MDLTAADASMDCSGTGLIGLAYDAIHLALLFAGLSYADSTRHVSVIVVIAGPIIHDDHVTFFKHIFARLSMRVGTIGSSCDDRTEGKLLRAMGEHIILKFDSNPKFCLTRAHKRDNVAESCISDALRLTHELKLLLIFGRTKARRDVAMQSRCEAGH